MQGVNESAFERGKRLLHALHAHALCLELHAAAPPCPTTTHLCSSTMQGLQRCQGRAATPTRSSARTQKFGGGVQV